MIDCDSAEALRAFRSGYNPPPTLTVKTARGFHFYYRGEMPARNGWTPWPLAQSPDVGRLIIDSIKSLSDVRATEELAARIEALEEANGARA